MKKIAIALIIGLIVGIIDVIPMYIMQLNWYANISAIVHWIVLGLLIPFIKWNIKAWLKGIIIATLCALPVIILTLEADTSSVLPILISSVILGAFTGITGKKFVE